MVEYKRKKIKLQSGGTRNYYYKISENGEKKRINKNEYLANIQKGGESDFDKIKSWRVERKRLGSYRSNRSGRRIVSNFFVNSKDELKNKLLGSHVFVVRNNLIKLNFPGIGERTFTNILDALNAIYNFNWDTSSGRMNFSFTFRNLFNQLEKSISINPDAFKSHNKNKLNKPIGGSQFKIWSGTVENSDNKSDPNYYVDLFIGDGPDGIDIYGDLEGNFTRKQIRVENPGLKFSYVDKTFLDRITFNPHLIIHDEKIQNDLYNEILMLKDYIDKVVKPALELQKKINH